MIDEQINVAIAEACGFTDCKMAVWDCDIGPEPIGRNRGWYSGYDGKLVRLPSFTTDLNAMHEAEKVLSPAERVDYTNGLAKICGTEKEKVFATARQRAEAFLKTKGLWR